MEKVVFILCTAAILFTSCNVNENINDIESKLTPNLNNSVLSDVPEEDYPESNSDVEFGCKFISHFHPDSNRRNINNYINCFNEKPKWWPNLSAPVIIPNWVLIQNPDNLPHPPIYSILKSDKDNVANALINEIIGTDFVNNPVTFSDFYLTTEQVNFLDDYFAQKILQLQELKAPNVISDISEDEETLFQIYTYFKGLDNDYPENFFGQAFEDNYSARLHSTPLTINYDWNSSTGKTNTTQIILSVTPPLIAKYPRYYFYLFMNPNQLLDYLISAPTP